MKIAIIGAGALGVMFGSLFAQDKNNEVIFLDVVDRVIDTINNEGCTCYDGDKTITSKVKAYKSGTVNTPYDLVIILTKTNFTKPSIESNLGLFGKDTYLLTIQNGLGNKEKLSKYVDEDHLLIAVTKNNAVKLGDNLSRRSNHNITTVGYNDHNLEFVKKFVDVMQKATFDCALSNNIDALVWEKAFLNLSVNAYCANYNLTIDELVTNKELWALACKTIDESVKVANALGQKFDVKKVTDQIYREMLGVNGRPSMWQDVNAKRPTEIMALNGRVVELGKELGIDVSENERITKCIIELQDSYKK